MKRVLSFRDKSLIIIVENIKKYLNLSCYDLLSCYVCMGSYNERLIYTIFPELCKLRTISISLLIIASKSQDAVMSSSISLMVNEVEQKMNLKQIFFFSTAEKEMYQAARKQLLRLVQTLQRTTLLIKSLSQYENLRREKRAGYLRVWQ